MNLKKNNKKENNDEINKTCNCDSQCDCGCNEGNECKCNDKDCGCSEGNECTCEGECECEECTCEDCASETESSCSGSCSGCSGCGSIDTETMVQILGSRNKELEEKYMRLQAEFLNFKTRTQSEISRMLQYEGEEFIKEMLVIKDNLERAVMMDDNDLTDDVSKFLSGIKMILGNLTSILDKYEIKEIECLGLEFDPNVAEAVLTEQDVNKPENVVLEVLTKGYKYKDKVIRHAMVKVNK